MGIWREKLIQFWLRGRYRSDDVPDSPRRRLIGGIIFILVGVLFLYLKVGRDWMMFRDAQHWQATSCVIRTSEISAPFKEVRGGTQYKPIIEYVYQFNGVEHVSRQYCIGDDASGYKSKIQAIVNSFVVGKNTICYVNPSNPQQAILNRQWSPAYPYILFSMTFVGMGLAVIWTAVLLRKSDRSLPYHLDKTLDGYIPSCDPNARSLDMASERIVSDGALVALPILLSFSIFFVVGLIEDVSNPYEQDISAIAIILIGLIATAFLAAVLVLIIRLIFPNVIEDQLRLIPGTLRPGQAAKIVWKFHRTRKYARLQIRLISSEVAVHANESMTRDQVRIYLDHELVDATNPENIGSGEVTFTLPKNTMHSMELPNNDITWKIRVIMVRANGKSTMEEYDVVVLPAKWPDRLQARRN